MMAEEPMSNDLLVSTDPSAACLFIVGANENSAGFSASELAHASSSRTTTIEVVVNGVKRVITVPIMPPEELVVTPTATSESCVRSPDVQPTISHTSPSVRDSEVHLQSFWQTMNNFPASNSAVCTGNAVSQQMPITAPHQILNNRTAVIPSNIYAQFQAPFTNANNNSRHHNNNMQVAPLTMQQDVRLTQIFSNRPVVSSAALPPTSKARYVFGNNPQQTFTSQPWNGNLCQLANIQPVKTVLPQAAMAQNASFVQPNSPFNRSLPVHGNHGGFTIQYHPLRLPSNSTVTSVSAIQWPSCVQQTSGSLTSQNNNQGVNNNLSAGSQLYRVPHTRYFSNSVQHGFISNGNVVSSKAVEDFARTYTHLYRAVNASTAGNAQLGKTDFQPVSLNLPLNNNFNSVAEQLKSAAAPVSSVQGKAVQFSDLSQLSHVESFQSQQVHRAVRSQKLHNIGNYPASLTLQSGMPLNSEPRNRAMLQSQLKKPSSSHKLVTEQDRYSQFRIAATRASIRPSDTAVRATNSVVTVLSSISATVANSEDGVRNVSTAAEPSISTLSNIPNLSDVGGHGGRVTTTTSGNTGPVNQAGKIANPTSMQLSIQAPAVSCVDTNARSTVNCDNSNDLIDKLLPDVMDSADSEYLLTAFADILEQQLPGSDSYAGGGVVNQPTRELASTPVVDQSSNPSAEIRNALQIAKSIGKGMHHVEEEKSHRHLLQKQRVRQNRRKQQLTNLEYDETCTNSSDSWHPDEFESQSTDKSPSSFIVSDSVSSESWTSNDSVTMGRKRRYRKTAPSNTQRRGSHKSNARWATRQRKKQKSILTIEKPDMDRISYNFLDIKPCSVKLEVIKMFGRQTLNVTEAEQSLCCVRHKVIWKAKRIIDSDDEPDIDSFSSDCIINRARIQRNKMPLISDSDGS